MGVAKTLSTTTSAPDLWAILETSLISTKSKHGFDGVSKKTALQKKLSRQSNPID